MQITGLLRWENILPPLIPTLGTCSSLVAVSYVFFAVVSVSNITSSDKDLKARAWVDLTTLPLLLANATVSICLSVCKVRTFLGLALGEGTILMLTHCAFMIHTALYAIELIKSGYDIFIQNDFLQKSKSAYSQYLHVNDDTSVRGQAAVLLGLLSKEENQSSHKASSLRLLGRVSESTDTEVAMIVDQVKANICRDGLDFLQNQDSGYLKNRITPWAHNEWSNKFTDLSERLNSSDPETKAQAINECFTLFEDFEAESRKTMVIQVIAFIAIAITLAGASAGLAGLPVIVPILLYGIGCGIMALNTITYYGCMNRKGWEFKSEDLVPDRIKNIFKKRSGIPVETIPLRPILVTA
jgi:hypothetical protein